MNLKKELIKAGFKDQTETSNSWDDELEFELYHDLPKGGIRIQKLTEFDELEIRFYSDSGYELLIGMVELEEVA